jgi:galactitol-specific phosphotransferase system IIB component
LTKSCYHSRADCILDKVADFQSKKPSQVFEVALNYTEGQNVYCESRFYFFIVHNFPAREGAKESSNKNNFIITSTYFNPEATNEMCIELLSSSQYPQVMDKIGFIGHISSDKTSTVSDSIKKALIVVQDHVARNMSRIPESESVILKELSNMPQFKEEDKSFYMKEIMQKTEIDLTAISDEKVEIIESNTDYYDLEISDRIADARTGRWMRKFGIFFWSP